MKAIVFVCLISFAFSFAFAETETNSVPEKTQAEKKSIDSNKSKKQEGTEHSFEDLLVQGKYHFSDSAVTTVEEDKVLDSLLGVRSDFKDRIEQSSGRW